MVMLGSIFSCLLAAIPLAGVEGEGLVTRAFLDVNNARVGDPLVLRVDFFGDADFTALHPPTLSTEVDPLYWRIDDRSAKTETVDTARRLVYRLRPMREGCYDFPALSFTYLNKRTGETAMLKTQKLPVHIKAGAQAALAALDEETAATAYPDGLFINLEESPWQSGAALSADELFAWRRACAQPSAEAFGAFNFPEARLNAAACELLSGHWAKAKSIYEALEWRIGETPAIRRGLRVARALETGDSAAELPAWRQVLQPLLKYDWRGRLACLLGGVVILALILFLLSRAARFFFSLALLIAFGALSPALAQSSPFEEMDKMMERFQENMGFRRLSMPEPKMAASVALDRNPVRIGEPFAFIVSVTCPKDVSIVGLNLAPPPIEGLIGLGRGEPMTDLEGPDTNSVVRRVAIPVRCDAPFKGHVSFKVGGNYEQRVQNRNSYFSVSRSFGLATKPVPIEISPLPQEGRPSNFTGIVATKLTIRPYAADTCVETNDVITLDVEVNYAGYIPRGALPGVMQDDRRGHLIYRLYERAEGDAKTPPITIPYYDLEKKEYTRAKAAGIPLRYTSPTTNAAPTRVAINLDDKRRGTAALLPIRFAPRREARILGTLAPSESRVTETAGVWVRLDDGRRAGWVLKSDWEATKNGK